LQIRSFVSGCAGLELSALELSFFARQQPWGLILFKRNCETPDQIRELIKAFRAAVQRKDAPVFVDQEGGRVQRLGPPHWPTYPAASAFGRLYERSPLLALRVARSVGHLMASDLFELGFTSSCLPVLDLPQPDSHAIIGDRAYSTRQSTIMALARSHVAGLMEGGILPVLKHIPGHGRAQVDSHHELPVVNASRLELETHDFPPFAALADLPMAMTAHVIYSAIDRAKPATTSRKVVRDVIRKVIGFNGLLMTDDLSMKALGGTMQEKIEASIGAGCDVVLHCNGNMDEMEQVAAAAPVLAGRSLRRAKQALKQRRKPVPYDEKQAALDMQAVLAS
jgi:beta-N-acetylhexosaminidase